MTAIGLSASVQQLDVNIKVPFALPDPPAPTLLASQLPGSKEIKAATDLRPTYRLSAARWEFLRSLPAYSGVAISSVAKNQDRLTHEDLRLFIGRIGFREQKIGPRDVVAVVMPNGPELAIALLCCMAWAVAAPLDPSMSADDLEDAFHQLKVTHTLALRRHKVYDGHIVSACEATGAKIHYLINDTSKAGVFIWAENDTSTTQMWANGKDAQAGFAGYGCSEEGGFNDTALVLRTSGTTSKPKVVPLTIRGLLKGASCISTGLKLQQSDICLNVMPLTHIGGISCSLLAVIVSGGSVICTAGFDPWAFYNHLADFRPTWYYAVPTIHHAVRLACPVSGPPKHSLRFIRSGADALADADARALSSLFACPVYPTYSMSECMPICQPPMSYNLSKPGSVGVPIGCSLRIAGPNGSALAYGEDGEVCISGDVVTGGYVENAEANSACFFEDGGRTWFRTGDLGHMDKDGFVFLSGRAKELIKRGGEQICPHEVEAVLLKNPFVQLALVFPVPNEFWGEEVAAVVVLRDGMYGEKTSKINATPPRIGGGTEAACEGGVDGLAMVQVQSNRSSDSSNRSPRSPSTGGAGRLTPVMTRVHSNRSGSSGSGRTASSSKSNRTSASLARVPQQSALQMGRLTSSRVRPAGAGMSSTPSSVLSPAESNVSVKSLMDRISSRMGPPGVGMVTTQSSSAPPMEQTMTTAKSLMKKISGSHSISESTVTAEDLINFAASNLPGNKVPRQIVFVAEEELPKTTTGKYKRRGLHQSLGVVAVDLKDEAALMEPICGAEHVPSPAKPHNAIYGIRFFASLWVVFIHVGIFPVPIQAWRNVSISMPCFFILAGFLLESSTTRPITETKRFFRNRVIAAHPIYLMSMLFAYPAFILSGPMKLEELIGRIVVGTIFLLLSPLGLGLLLSGPAWFMHIYYPLIALFPYMNRALSNSRLFNLLANPTAPCCSPLDRICGVKCIRYIGYPIAAWITVFTVFNMLIFGTLMALFGMGVAYVSAYLLGLPLWLGVFVCGMLTFRVFEHNHRGEAAEKVWQHWGKLTDSMSILLLMSLMLQSYLAQGPNDYTQLQLDFEQVGAGRCSSYLSCLHASCTDSAWEAPDCFSINGAAWAPVELDNAPGLCYHGRRDVACTGASDGQNLTSGSFCWKGLRHVECGAGGASVFDDYRKVPVNMLLGMTWSRPARLSTPFLCVYIYGLAVGRGMTAKVLGSRFMVKWMAPAAYPLYLFHFPLGQYWLLIKHALGGSDPEKQGYAFIPMSWWEFLLFVPTATALAMLVAHVLNSHATYVFVNSFDYIYCCLPEWCCGTTNRITDTCGQNALFTIVDAVAGLTGADVDGTTPLTQLGLDSFGASALIGILRSRLPDVPLSAADIYSLETVGDIAQLIERARAASKADEGPAGV